MLRISQHYWDLLHDGKVVSIVGAVIAFVFVSGEYPTVFGYKSEYIISIVVAVIGFINLLDLVFNVDGRARLHTDLYRRYKALQEKIARDSGTWERHLNNWKAAAKVIEIDEPPVFYALYADYWNLAVQRFGAEEKYLRTIKGWQRRLRHYRHFQPIDFPPHVA
jgi:hypothetical protein